MRFSIFNVSLFEPDLAQEAITYIENQQGLSSTHWTNKTINSLNWSDAGDHTYWMKWDQKFKFDNDHKFYLDDSMYLNSTYGTDKTLNLDQWYNLPIKEGYEAMPRKEYGIDGNKWYLCYLRHRTDGVISQSLMITANQTKSNYDSEYKGENKRHELRYVSELN